MKREPCPPRQMDPGVRNSNFRKKDHKNNEFICNAVATLVGPPEHLLAKVKGCKLLWFTMSPDTTARLPEPVLQRYVQGWCRGRQKKKLAEECERMDRPRSKRPNGWTRLNPLARIRRCSSPFKDRQWLESSPRVPVKGVMIMIMMMM